MPEAVGERARRKSREGYVQYLLACLVLGGRPRGWNKPDSPSRAGSALLQAIDRRCFGDAWVGPSRFAWEHILPADGTGTNLWPDYAALWADRTLLFELKTEAGSVREGQVDAYLERALRQTDHQVDFVYITRDPVAGVPPLDPSRSRYVAITWHDLLELLVSWALAEAPEEEKELALFIDDFVNGELYEGRTVVPVTPATPQVLGTAAPSAPKPLLSVGPPVEPGHALDEAVRTAWDVESDRRGRAVNTLLPSREAVEALKTAAKKALRAAPPAHARPWTWCVDTSTGPALTTVGEETGFELRFEYVVKGVKY